MSDTNTTANPPEQGFDLEQEMEAWNWARAAGVSAQDLHKALRESLGGQEPK